MAADGQHPVPSSREHASASASSTRRSLPDIGEFSHTPFITAMLTLPTYPTLTMTACPETTGRTGHGGSPGIRCWSGIKLRPARGYHRGGT